MCKDYMESVKEYMDKFLDKTKPTLDLGCGEGPNVKDFKRIIGIDVNKDVIKNYSHKAIIHDLNYGIPFKDKKFDQVLCLELLEHFRKITNMKKLINESYRVLKNDGLLLITTPNRGRWTLKIRSLLGKPKKYPYRIVQEDSDYKNFAHVHYYEFIKSEMENFLSDAGFKKFQVQEQFIDLPLIRKGIDKKSSFGKALFAVAWK